MNQSTDRKIILDVLISLTPDFEFSNLVLANVLNKNKQLSNVSRAFITEVVNGTVRNIIEIDYIINQFSNVKINKMKHCVKNILRMSVYQILKMRVPDSAVVNEAVNLTKQCGYTGLAGFVNGVLRSIVRNSNSISYPDKISEPINYLCTKYSFANWIIDYLVSHYGFEFTESFCIDSNFPPNITLSVNNLKTDTDSLYFYFKKHNIDVSYGMLHDCLHVNKASDLTRYTTFQKGLFFVQDLSSMICVSVLDPKPNDVVIDLCSAPGGKSFRIASIMGNKGTIISRDITNQKVEMIKNSAKRLGFSIIKAELSDATVLDNNCINIADKVLVDAPCSGLGLVRKKPDIKYTKTLKQIETLVEKQREILRISVNYLKPTGTLVYSTCTLTDYENIDNVNWILDNLPLELCDITPYIPFTSDTAKNGYITLLPNVHGTDGFFVARFKKIHNANH